MFFVTVVIFVLMRKQEHSLISPISSSALRSEIPARDTKGVTDSQLRSVVEESLKDAKGDYAVVVYNLKTNENFSINEHKEFDAGSLYKLWVMGAVYEQLESGIWKEDTVLSEEISILNEKFNLATESAELAEGKISLPVKTALERMITISDNYSALLLAWKLRLSKVTSYMDTKGFAESKLGGAETLPTTTAYDIALFFERLYGGQLAPSDTTSKMISLLKAQKLNNKLPKLLPEKTVIAHKTGELGLATHDAGIVYSPKGDYIIVVMSKSNLPKGAEERIAQLSKMFLSILKVNLKIIYLNYII